MLARLQAKFLYDGLAMYSFDQVVDRRGTHSLKWTRYGRDVLPLWIADMDFPAPEPVRAALHHAIDHGVFGYELPSRRLREIVAARLGRLYGWRIGPEMVVAAPGIVTAFKAAARAVCTQGEGVLVQTPVYPPFLAVPAETGTASQVAQLRKTSEGHVLSYDVDRELFESAFHSNGVRTGMFLLCSPHNPTGQIFSRNELEQMAEVCLRNGTVICSDEIHSELLLGDGRHTPLASLDREFAQNSITLVSASKTFNVVGLLCGFAIISDPALRRRYRKVLEDLGLHVNSLGLIAAEVALSGECDAWLDALRAYLTGNRDYLVQFVASELPGVRVTVPQATYLAWLDFAEWRRSGRLPEEPYAYFLEKAKVALNPGANFGPGGENCARLNFACPRSVLAEALERIKTAVGVFEPGS